MDPEQQPQAEAKQQVEQTEAKEAKLTAAETIKKFGAKAEDEKQNFIAEGQADAQALERTAGETPPDFIQAEAQAEQGVATAHENLDKDLGTIEKGEWGPDRQAFEDQRQADMGELNDQRAALIAKLGEAGLSKGDIKAATFDTVMPEDLWTKLEGKKKGMLESWDKVNTRIGVVEETKAAVKQLEAQIKEVGMRQFSAEASAEAATEAAAPAEATSEPDLMQRNADGTISLNKAHPDAEKYLGKMSNEQAAKLVRRAEHPATAGPNGPEDPKSPDAGEQPAASAQESASGQQKFEDEKQLELGQLNDQRAAMIAKLGEVGLSEKEIKAATFDTEVSDDIWAKLEDVKKGTFESHEKVSARIGLVENLKIAIKKVESLIKKANAREYTPDTAVDTAAQPEAGTAEAATAEAAPDNKNEALQTRIAELRKFLEVVDGAKEDDEISVAMQLMKDEGYQVDRANYNKVREQALTEKEAELKAVESQLAEAEAGAETEHIRSGAELDDDEIGAAMDAEQARRDAARAETASTDAVAEDAAAEADDDEYDYSNIGEVPAGMDAIKQALQDKKDQEAHLDTDDADDEPEKAVDEKIDDEQPEKETKTEAEKAETRIKKAFQRELIRIPEVQKQWTTGGDIKMRKDSAGNLMVMKPGAIGETPIAAFSKEQVLSKNVVGDVQKLQPTQKEMSDNLLYKGEFEAADKPGKSPDDQPGPDAGEDAEVIDMFANTDSTEKSPEDAAAA